MLNTVIARFQDSNYLTRLFHSHSLLVNGKVSGCELIEIPGIHSSFCGLLKLQYQGGDTSLPEQMVIKLAPLSSGYHETLFRQLIHKVASCTVAPIIASGIDREVNTCFAFMPDYRATHRLLCQPEESYAIGCCNPDLAGKAVQVLARFHNDMQAHVMMQEVQEVQEELGLGRYRSDPKPLLASIPRCCRLVGKFEEESYSQDTAQLLRQLLPQAVHYWNDSVRPRFRSGSNLTIVHGDCLWHHFWIPRDNHQKIMLFDFDLTTVHSPVWDLVTLLSTRLGDGLQVSELLKTYRQATDMQISRDELEQEFAWLSLCQVFHVLADWEHGCSDVIWLPRLHSLLKNCRAFTAS